MPGSPAALTPRHDVVDVSTADGVNRLRTTTWGDGVPSIVMLHDGIGSVTQWRSVPEDIANATGATVMAYDRAGHGASTPVPTGPWPADWLHREAEVLGGLLAAVGADDPLLVGHSDGGSIALIHAANGGVGRGLVSLAAHVWVESVTVQSIHGIRGNVSSVVGALGKHHDAPADVFEAWSGGWVSAAFQSWDVRPMLGSITMPVVAVQGDGDEYATPAHLDEVVSAIGDNARSVMVANARHLLHHDVPETVTAIVADAFAGPSPH